MHQLALAFLTRCAWALAYYDPYQARGHGHHGALRTLANVWLHLLFRVLQDRAPYNDARFAAARARRQAAQASWLPRARRRSCLGGPLGSACSRDSDCLTRLIAGQQLRLHPLSTLDV